MVNLYMRLGSFLGGGLAGPPPMAVWTFSSPWQLGLNESDDENALVKRNFT